MLAARHRDAAPSSTAVGAAVLAALVVAFGTARDARAAALTVEAPASCVDPAALADDVAELVGKPIASVPDVDFRIQIAGTAHQRWRLRLETVDHQAPGTLATVRGTRELEAANCVELAEAAALAIAVSLRAAEVKPSPSVRAPTVAPTPPMSEGAPVPAPPLIVRAVSPAPAKAPWRAGLGLGVVVESGVLPNVAPGIEVEAKVSRAVLGVALRGVWFGAQDTVDTSASGGSFQLAAGSALACFLPRHDRWAASACAGFELGRLAGTGLNVARPQTRAALWAAGRADAGVARRVSADAAVFLRLGVAVPMARPAFVLDESRVVHRPGPVAGSLAAGIELGF